MKLESYKGHTIYKRNRQFESGSMKGKFSTLAELKLAIDSKPITVYQPSKNNQKSINQ